MTDASETVASRGPCPDCGGLKSLVTYLDGHQYCYIPGCGLKRGSSTSDNWKGSSMDQEEEHREPRVRNVEEPTQFTTRHMPDGLKKRGLKLDTLSKAGYFVDDEGNHVCSYYDIKTSQLAQQKRRNKDKEFWFTPIMQNAPRPHELQLFMQNVWGEKYDKKVIITEGELDALSVAQALNFKSAAVVSIPAGTGSAVKAIQANYRWLDRFEEVIFWMDNDEPGQKLIPELASMFPGKAKVIKIEGYKDASDMLQAGKEGDVYGAVWSAVTYMPEGIVNAADLVDDMDLPEGEKIIDWPYPKLNAMTLGIREGDVCYHVAGTGIGKTTQMVELQVKLIEANIKFGVLRFEDTRKKAMLDIMSAKAGRRLHINPLPIEEMRALHAKVFGQGSMEMFDPETANWDFKSVMGYIRYMVLGLRCKVVFIDPLSFIVAGHMERDERKALDNVAYEFAKFVKQTKGNLQIGHHLRRADGKAHEEGGQVSVNEIRGSGGIANFSMVIVGHERDQQGDKSDLTGLRLLKNRFTGELGEADVLRWNKELGRQEVCDEPYPIGNDKDGGEQGFKRSSEY